MTDAFAEFHFLRPAWLAAFALLPLFALWWRSRGRGGGPWDAVVTPALRPYVLDGSVTKGSRARTWRWVAALGFVLAVVALAGPAWRKIPQPVFRSQAALVIALDLSRSMDARDLAPSRLARAKLKLLDLLERREEGQTALIVYAAEPFVVSPLTNDAATIAALVESLGTELMPVQGSRADRALALAEELLQQAGLSRGEVLLITDGVHWRDGEAVTALRHKGLRVSVLGVGTADGAPIPLAQGGLLEDSRGVVMARFDEAGARDLAARGGGAYSALRVDDADLDAVIPAGGDATAPTDTTLSTDLWREEGPWLLLPLCLLAALAFRRGWVGVILLATLPWSAQALEWDALWSRDDQRGVAALEEGDAARAAELFEDPEWKASALYRAGQYVESAQLLSGLDAERALYNRGNALARAGNYPEAIQAYERALELDPNDADARHNLELLKQQMPPQPQSGQQGGQGKQGEQSGQNAQAESGEQGGEQSQSDEGAPPPAGEEGGPPSQSPGGEDQESQGAQSQSAEAQQREREERSQGESEEDRGGDANAPTAQTDVSTAEQEEAARATEQWLRRIPDDPGGLLRRKFLYQYRQRQQLPSVEEAQEW